MFGKNRNKKVGICLMVVTACLILAGLWAVLATPETALAGPPPHDDHGGGDDGTYNVTVFGDVSPTTPTTFTGKDGGGRSKPVNVYGQFLNLNLKFFSNKIVNGEDCFDAAPLFANLTAMTISQEKDSSALVGYWFTGFGDDGTTEINYLLWMFGNFEEGNWPPAETGDKTTFVNLTSWEMTTESKKNKNISCTGSGNFAVTIEVERTN